MAASNSTTSPIRTPSTTGDTTPDNNKATWQHRALQKRKEVYSKIPPAWHLTATLPPALLSTLLPRFPTPQTCPTAPPPAPSPLSVLHIPAHSSILSPAELDITTKYDATALVEAMGTGKLKCVDVVTAFCKRAAVAQQCVNCLTEIMFEEAIEQAREYDEIVKKEEKRMGRLWGLPISLKDSFNVRGTHTTIGYVDFIDRPPATIDSTLVSLLRAEGAIFYCKTNLPQTMMTADSHNNVFGRTLNPYNLGLTPGGSTGGEGALIAMGGSVLGLATDIGGSCRIPALCCGLFSYKPTAGRIPFGGKVAPGRLGAPSPILPVIGPMGRSVRDAELMLKTIITDKTWDLDENVLGIPWREVAPVTRPLRFGLIRGHAQRPLHPPIARALHTAAMRMKTHGHEIVLLDDLIPDIWNAWTLACKYYSLDPKNTPLDFLNASGEPFVPSVAKSPLADISGGWHPTVDDLFEMNVERAKIVRGFHNVIVEQGLDAVLMPGYQATAVPHDQFGQACYTALQNLLNYPSAILPFLEANSQLDEAFIKSDAAYEPPYNAEIFEGMPAHVQVMGKPLQDEELIEILKVVEGILAE